MKLNYSAKESWLPFYSTTKSEYVEKCWSVTNQALLEINDFLEENNSKFIVLGIDNAFTVDIDVYDKHFPVDSEYNIHIPLLRLKSFLEKNNISFSNCQPHLQNLKERINKKVYNYPEGSLSSHLEESGEIEVAKQAIRLIMDTNLIMKDNFK